MTEITVQNNTVVRVHYTGTLPETGEVFDSSEGKAVDLSGWSQANDIGF